MGTVTCAETKNKLWDVFSVIV